MFDPSPHFLIFTHVFLFLQPTPAPTPAPTDPPTPAPTPQPTPMPTTVAPTVAPTEFKRGKLADIIKYVYEKVSVYETLQSQGVRNIPDDIVPTYYEAFDKFRWNFVGLEELVQTQPDLVREILGLKYPDKFMCGGEVMGGDGDESPIASTSRRRLLLADADPCYTKLVPLISIMDDDEDSFRRKSILQNFNKVYEKVTKKLEQDAADDREHRAEEMKRKKQKEAHEAWLAKQEEEKQASQ